MSYAFLDRVRRGSHPRTLGLRLVIAYALLYVVSTAVLAVLAYLLFMHFMRKPDRVLMRMQAYELSDAYERDGFEALRWELFSDRTDERREELIVRLSNANGGTLLLYNPDNWKVGEIALLDRPPAHDTWQRLGAAEDDDPLEAFTLRLSDGGVLQVGMDADLRKDALASMREVFLAIALPVLVLGLLGGALISYRALQPMRQLVSTLESVIDTGDVKTRVPVGDVRGEFAAIVHLFNRMLCRIEGLVAGMRGTLDNVAHDLRTPVTRLRGRAELTLQEERDSTAYREALIETVEASDGVMAVLDTIMDLAEAETGTMPLSIETVPVADLIDDVVELYRFVAEEKGVAIDARLPPASLPQCTRRTTEYAFPIQHYRVHGMSIIRICLLFVLIALTAACSSRGNEPAATTPADNASAEISGDSFPYEIGSPVASSALPEEMTEISGLGILDDGRLAAVQDEDGILFLLDPETGTVVSRIEFGKGGDYEGVEPVGDRMFILKSAGELIELVGWEQGSPTVRSHKTELKRKNDMEGLAYDASNGRLLMVTKEDPGSDLDEKRHKAIYAFDPAAGKLDSEPAFTMNLEAIEDALSGVKNFRPSALAVHPASRDIYVLSSTDRAIVILGSSGSLKHATELSERQFEQPEGLAFTPNGDLLIASEGVDGPAMLFRYAAR